MKVFKHLSFSPMTATPGKIVADVSGTREDVPVAIAFATPEYETALANLEEDFNIYFGASFLAARMYVYSPRVTVNPRRAATHLKASFIEWCLRTFNRPVWYFDADTRLKGPPPDIDPKYWGAFHRQPSRDKLGFPVRSSMFFLRPQSATFEFLESWHSYHKPELEDHTPLCKAWQHFQHTHYYRKGMFDSDFSKWAQCDGTKVKSDR